MAWGMLAAAALPYIVGAFQKKPKYPGGSPQVALPDRSAYTQAILDGGFNTDSTAYQRASDVARDQVNRILARQGLAGSSIGGQVAASQQNQLANAFVEDKLRRQQQALATVNQMDMQRAQVEQGNAQAAYEAARQQYADQMQRRQGAAQGLGAIANVAANVYESKNAQSLIDRRRAEDRAFMQNLYTPKMTASYTPMPSMPGYMPSYGAPYESTTTRSTYGLNYNFPGF